MVTHSLDRPGGKKTSRCKAWLSFSASMIALLGVFTIFVFGPLALHAYDRAHPQVIKCDVMHAEATSVNVQSTNLSSTRIPRVAVTTKGCGALAVQRGVTVENRDRIAEEIDGRTCQFVVGVGSFQIRAFLGLFRVVPEVSSYKVVG
jgi:hypothetical protein